MKKYYFTLLMAVIASSLAGQNSTRSSIFIWVKSEFDHEPLIGASVSNMNTRSGTCADLNGRLEIEVGESDLLEFRYAGCESVVYPVYEIVHGMHQEVELITSIALREVVITGYRTGRGGTTCGGWPVDYEKSDSLQIRLSNTWSYYPNPTTGGVTVETPESTGLISVFTLDGTLAGQYVVSGPFTKVDLQSLPAATYFLFYENENWSSPVGKVVLNTL